MQYNCRETIVNNNNDYVLIFMSIVRIFYG